MKSEPHPSTTANSQVASFQPLPRERQNIREALLTAHRRLANDLQALEEAVRPGAANLEALRSSLAATYTHVCDHFHGEEHHGYLTEVRRRAPHLEHDVVELQQEHRQLRMALDDLLAKARLAKKWEEALAESARDWLHRLRRHESKENQVVQDAFNRDFSAED
ncbi:MAG: hemerythrin domain-containing protein [Gemmataceae bacterium]|nr:hemerythrin domain-containing protein [Gemmataceae bacterium]